MKTKLKKYIVPTVAALAIAVAAMLVRKILNAANASEVFGIISDGFFSAAVLVGGTGLISIAGKFGIFDMLKYGTRTFLGNFVLSIRENTPHTFYDYVEEQEEKGRKWLVEFTVVGGVCLVIGIGATVLYSAL